MSFQRALALAFLVSASVDFGSVFVERAEAQTTEKKLTNRIKKAEKKLSAVEKSAKALQAQALASKEQATAQSDWLSVQGERISGAEARIGNLITQQNTASIQLSTAQKTGDDAKVAATKASNDAAAATLAAAGAKKAADDASAAAGTVVGKANSAISTATDAKQSADISKAEAKRAADDAQESREAATGLVSQISRTLDQVITLNDGVLVLQGKADLASSDSKAAVAEASSAKKVADEAKVVATGIAATANSAKTIAEETDGKVTTLRSDVDGRLLLKADKAVIEKSLTDGLALKADKNVIEKSLADGLALKADASVLPSLATDQELSTGLAPKANTDYVNQELAKKADASLLPSLATDTELSAGLALKADASVLPSLATDQELSAGLEPKANTDYVNQELAKKADASVLPSLATDTELSDALAPKANTDYVNQELAKKADASLLPSLATDTELSAGLALKADASVLPSLTTDQELSAGLEPKANTDYVNQELAKKANGNYVGELPKAQIPMGAENLSHAVSLIHQDISVSTGSVQTRLNAKADELSVQTRLDAKADKSYVGYLSDPNLFAPGARNLSHGVQILNSLMNQKVYLGFGNKDEPAKKVSLVEAVDSMRDTLTNPTYFGGMTLTERLLNVHATLTGEYFGDDGKKSLVDVVRGIHGPGGLTNRVGASETRLDSSEARLDSSEARLDASEPRIGTVEGRVFALESRNNFIGGNELGTLEEARRIAYPTDSKLSVTHANNTGMGDDKGRFPCLLTENFDEYTPSNIDDTRGVTMKVQNPGTYLVMVYGRNINGDGNEVIRFKVAGSVSNAWEASVGTSTVNGAGLSVSTIVDVTDDAFGEKTGSQIKMVRDCNSGTSLDQSDQIQSEYIHGINVVRIGGNP